MNFLAIECATSTPGVALCLNDKIEDQIQITDGNSSALAPMIDNVLKQHDFIPSKFDFIAVTIGPGTFTGLRVGISIAQGFSYSINKPIVPINVLDVIKSHMNTEDKNPIAFHSHGEFIYYRETETSEIRLIKVDEIKGKSVSGCNLDQFSATIKYNKIQYSQQTLAEYARDNFERLMENDIGSISPIYLNEFM